MSEDLKQRLLTAIVAFNLVLIAYQVIWNSNPFSVTGLLLGIVLGAAAGGATFGIQHFLANR